MKLKKGKKVKFAGLCEHGCLGVLEETLGHRVGETVTIVSVVHEDSVVIKFDKDDPYEETRKSRENDGLNNENFGVWVCPDCLEY